MPDTYADVSSCPGSAFARAEANGSLEMLDCELGFSRKQSDPAAPYPSVSEARVEMQGSIDQRGGRGEVITELSESVGASCNKGWIVNDQEHPSSKIKALPARQLQIIGPVVDVEISMAGCCQRESGAIVGVAIKCLLEQIKRAQYPDLFPRLGLR